MPLYRQRRCQMSGFRNAILRHRQAFKRHRKTGNGQPAVRLASGADREQVLCVLDGRAGRQRQCWTQVQKSPSVLATRPSFVLVSRPKDVRERREWRRCRPVR